jgi:hypothetical protein
VLAEPLPASTRPAFPASVIPAASRSTKTKCKHSPPCTPVWACLPTKKRLAGRFRRASDYSRPAPPSTTASHPVSIVTMPVLIIAGLHLPAGKHRETGIGPAVTKRTDGAPSPYISAQVKRLSDQKRRPAHSKGDGSACILSDCLRPAGATDTDATGACSPCRMGFSAGYSCQNSRHPRSAQGIFLRGAI